MAELIDPLVMDTAPEGTMTTLFTPPNHKPRSPLLAPTVTWRGLFALIVVAVLLTVNVRPATADRQWWRTDPVIQVNGQVAHIIVSGHPDILGNASGPTRVVVSVPTGATTAFLDADNGFGFGYDVTFVEDPALPALRNQNLIGVAVHVPTINGPFPVMVEVFTNDGTRLRAHRTGTSDAWVSLRVAL